MIEFLNIFGWGMIVLSSSATILFSIKKITGFQLSQNIKAALCVPFVVVSALMLAKIAPFF